jgi:hypothetical protein
MYYPKIGDVKKMDEITELKRIWESTEKRLSDIQVQIREYTITDNSKNIVGKIDIPADAAEDQIIEILNDETDLLNPDIEYFTGQDGSEDQININRDNGDNPSTTEYELSTNEEIEDFDQFMQDALDIERVQYLSGRDGWITKMYTVVLGTGGPHVEFTTSYSINVYWGGKSQEFTTYDDNARATIDRVEDYLNEIYQES